MTADQSLQPTKPELEILKLLWRRKSLSAREIADEIAAQLGWSYSTLRTVLERMCEKGLVKKRAKGGVNSYSAGVAKITLLGRMIQDFSGRVLELDAAPPAVLFAQSKLLTHDEVEELEELLRSKEREQ